MNEKTYLLSFLMMDIYNNHVLRGSPLTLTELERAMDFVEMAEGLMKKRGWLAALPPAGTTNIHAVPVPGAHLYDFGRQSPTEHPLPVSDASGAA